MSKQLKLNQQVYFSSRGNYPRYVPARQAGEEVARICHGLFDWQGVRECLAPRGLKHAADHWLKKHNISSGKAVVIEFEYDEENSRYSASWKD